MEFSWRLVNSARAYTLQGVSMSYSHLNYIAPYLLFRLGSDTFSMQRNVSSRRLNARVPVMPEM
jgi:hypothetical protein